MAQVGGGGSRGRGGVAAASPSDNGEDRGVSLFVDHAPCVRLFHSGGDVGCRAEPKEGVAGPLLLVNSEGVLRDIEVHFVFLLFFGWVWKRCLRSTGRAFLHASISIEEFL